MSVMERDTETLIDTQLRNLLWIEDPKNPKRNVYKQQPKTDEQKKKLRGLKPDYVLYRSDSDAPLIVIEAKKPRRNIHEALQQGMAYAERINAPIVFATDGVFTKTIHQVTKQPLLLNGNEIDEFIREVLAIQYIGTSEYNSI
ncbi:MAG TPA: type I restriction enzyme HsdR N-terminal domain-containing protein, partial [Anaerolineales bacterium]|nr:type I restriction enzyme HsdR N-terminal domain-containing protein [Anaerolineales bacterium]